MTKTRANGTQIPQQQVDNASQAINQLHGINLASITQEFDTLANSINTSMAREVVMTVSIMVSNTLIQSYLAFQ